MLRSYLVVALRHLRSQKVFASLNIIGLSLGFACFTVIALFVRDELSYDKHYPEADSIYRIERAISNGQGTRRTAKSPPVWIPELPARVTQANSLLRAIGELGEDERRAAFYAFVSLANKVAVADRMPLGDAETLPRAIDKAASIASHGLDWIGAQRSLPLADVLRRTTLENLFRVGASLDRSAALESPPK